MKQKIEKPFASYEGPSLRKGSNIDSGNIEFLTNGYGGFKDFVCKTLFNKISKRISI